MILVPERSLVLSTTQTGDGDEFFVLGPIPAGRILSRASVVVGSFTAGTLDLALSLGSSESTTLAALEAGIPLVRVAEARIGTVGALRIASVAGEVHSFGFFFGAETLVGASWLVVGLSALAATAVLWNLSVEVLRMERELERVVVSTEG